VTDNNNNNNNTIAFQHQQEQAQHQQFPFSPEGMILHSAHQLTNPHGFAMDPALAGAGHHNLPQYSEHNGHAPIQNAHFSEFRDSPMLETEFDDDDISFKETKGRKKGSNGEVASDSELRRLHSENQHRNLEEIGGQLRQDENGPQSEKTRQIFAMKW
jgi:regulatory factor X, other